MDKSIAALIWEVAEVLRGDYKQNEYGSIILPFTVLRRLDCLLDSTRDKVFQKWEMISKQNPNLSKINSAIVTPDLVKVDKILNQEAGLPFHSKTNISLTKIQTHGTDIRTNLKKYVRNFSANVTEIFIKFKFIEKITELDKKNLLFEVVKKFNAVNLHPNKIDSYAMGLLYEELLRKFAEMSNETAGEHFTPREIVNLIINVLFAPDDKILADKSTIKSIYDPTCGTGGMLALAEEYLHKKGEGSEPALFGQELNDETFAMCKASILIKGKDLNKIANGNALSNDAFPKEKFDYMLANPPYGVDWNKIKECIANEHEKLGFTGRFGAGLPRISDGQLLFVQHLLAKMKPVNKQHNGSRIGIVLNGSPLFTGNASSGESDIRKWILENDYLESLIALPNDMFFNTGIATYIWILTNRKTAQRKGKVQLINANSFYQKMRKSLGSKRNELSTEHIKAITQIYCDFTESEHSKIFENYQFGYTTITIEQPLRMSFTISQETINKLQQDKTFGKFDALIQHNIIGKLTKLIGTLSKDKAEFIQFLKTKLKPLTIKDSQIKLILKACGQRDEKGSICTDSKGNIEVDPELRGSENVPLISLDYKSAQQKEHIQKYLESEVLTHAPNAWIDWTKNKVGFEISFNRYFYKYNPPRDLIEIDKELKLLSGEIQILLNEVCGAG